MELMGGCEHWYCRVVAGVELADMLSDRLGLRSNGSEGSEARRNKYHMGEKVGKLRF